MYVYIDICVCVYIYIEREREPAVASGKILSKMKLWGWVAFVIDEYRDNQFGRKK